mgnify:CR=1 FL=1
MKHAWLTCNETLRFGAPCVVSVDCKRSDHMACACVVLHTHTIQIAVNTASQNGGESPSVTQLSGALEDLGTTQDILNFLFATMAVVAMFLCFFSLVASMVTNIREQTKEAGVLRALGLPYVHTAPWFLVEMSSQHSFQWLHDVVSIAACLLQSQAAH